MKIKIYQDFFAAASICVAALGVAHAQPVQSGPASSGVIHLSSHSGPIVTAKDVEMRALSAEIEAVLVRRRSRRLTSSDKVSLESLYLREEALEPYNPYHYNSLAKLYEEEGKSDLAYLQWQKMFGAGVSRSNLQAEAAILTHYGDLALSRGNGRVAVDAYRKCLPNDLVELDRPDALFQDMDVLRGAAHYRAAQENIAHGQLSNALNDFKVCMPAFSHSSEVRSAYGHLLFQMGDIKNAKIQMKFAESYCHDKATRDALHSERARLGLIRTVSSMVINNGHMTQSIKEVPGKD